MKIINAPVTVCIDNDINHEYVIFKNVDLLSIVWLLSGEN